MFYLSERRLLVVLLVGFVSICWFSLLRAESIIVQGYEAEQAEEVIALDFEPFVEVGTVEEAEAHVSFNVSSVMNVPDGYERLSVSYHEEDGRVRQVFTNHKEGRLMVEQAESPLSAPKEAVVNVIKIGNKEVTLYGEGDEIYGATWSTGTSTYSVHSLRSFDLNQWKELMIGIY
ncbi:hypothetical protein N781_03835 [Pontibacillus halophilus JSM 076056 = DSM 19796]|uniref:DUF4367 domain-containing protein n=1 Tax=Pontibacillus halophilus JSM 076056 = DSM 19796 TaxID=1385510 RepID=A0A0A5GEP3_9BACI|nr:hypothetical protein [Pontibacillus halophilus]KGX91686.1 hypothetical protein N781_03835 [Pontibacillus halophilus JSM 076056 = DSM 19796]